MLGFLSGLADLLQGVFLFAEAASWWKRRRRDRTSGIAVQPSAAASPPAPPVPDTAAADAAMQLEGYCDACGSLNEPGDTACSNCGQSMAPAPSNHPPPVPPGNRPLLPPPPRAVNDAPWSGDPLIAAEARRLQEQQHRDAQQDQKPRQTGGRGCLVALGVAIGIAGPFVAIFSMMSGDLLLVISITVGSCGLAGLSLAAASRGIRGALAALGVPLLWVVVADSLSNGLGEIESAEVIVFLGGFLLIQAVSAEAGYLAGRLIAGLVRRPSPAASAR